MKNKILKLEAKNGDWKERAQLDSLIVEYFYNLFSSTGLEGPINFLQPLEGRITKAMNEELGQEFTKHEVFSTLQQLHPKKVSGSNGMSLLFFQKYWHLIGDFVTAVVL